MHLHIHLHIYLHIHNLGCCVASDIVHNAESHVRVISLLITSSIWTEPSPDLPPPRKSLSRFVRLSHSFLHVAYNDDDGGGDVDVLSDKKCLFIFSSFQLCIVHRKNVARKLR